MTRSEWQKYCTERGTHSGQVFSILKDWKECEEALRANFCIGHDFLATSSGIHCTRCGKEYWAQRNRRGAGGEIGDERRDEIRNVSEV